MTAPVAGRGAEEELQGPGSRGAPCSGVVGVGGGVRAAALLQRGWLCMGSWLAAGLCARGQTGTMAEVREEVWWCTSAAGGDVALGGGQMSQEKEDGGREMG